MSPHAPAPGGLNSRSLRPSCAPPLRELLRCPRVPKPMLLRLRKHFLDGTVNAPRSQNTSQYAAKSPPPLPAAFSINSARAFFPSIFSLETPAAPHERPKRCHNRRGCLSFNSGQPKIFRLLPHPSPYPALRFPPWVRSVSCELFERRNRAPFTPHPSPPALHRIQYPAALPCPSPSELAPESSSHTLPPRLAA